MTSTSYDLETSNVPVILNVLVETDPVLKGVSALFSNTLYDCAIAVEDTSIK